MTRRAVLACLGFVLGFALIGCGGGGSRSLVPLPQTGSPNSERGASLSNQLPGGGSLTYRDYANQAVATLLSLFYAGNGSWRTCTDPTCPTTNSDWGADSLTYTMFLRRETTGDPAIAATMSALAAAAPSYPPPCHGLAGVRCTWSDVAEWDAVAELREYAVTSNPSVLQRAITAFEAIEGSEIYALGACPAIRYQQPFGYLDHLKTLETEATAIKAATLLYDATGDKSYLKIATQRYEAVRQYFLDPQVPLYTVYVFDDFAHCTPVPHRFFASVNGEMISNGLELYRATGYQDHTYLDQAVATASAVDADLADARGVFADLQTEYDIVEPLVEAMYDLATREGERFAVSWLVRNADAAISARKPDGTFGRFFDGPPPAGMTTAWQTNGGFALLMAASALPTQAPAQSAAWAAARFVPHVILSLPATLQFYGSGIALIGPVGDIPLQPGHARVLIDGRETFDQTGIWQNSVSVRRRIPGSVLFAWQWPTAGTHTLQFLPGVFNIVEGPAYLHVDGYEVMGDTQTIPSSAR
jgi:hypothetical protein